MKTISEVSVIILLLFSGFQYTDAQTKQRELYALTNVYHHAGFVALKITDPYLSVLEYSGVGFQYESTASRFFNPANPVLASSARISGLAAMTVNPRSTASVTWLGANVSWGVQYYYRNFEDVLLLGGANVDVDFAYKMNSRNVNNPINIDLATNLNLTLGGRYYIHTKNRILQLNAGVEFPVMGCMFVPYPGFSYYEMYSTKMYMDAVHFSSLHNKQGLKQFFSIDIPFRYSTWSFGVGKNDLKYTADSQVYSYSDFTFVIGISYDMIGFSGRKANVPDFFISPRY
ncbi:MAG: hypothetical protein VB102_03615 [Paludibacter sp.]|nr:hypothetical protein [Paludibacter sp.]